MVKTIYLSDKEASIFSEIEVLAKRDDRGVGYKIIEIFREWKGLKESTEAGSRGLRRHD
jgi:hypothetical protein